MIVEIFKMVYFYFWIIFSSFETGSYVAQNSSQILNSPILDSSCPHFSFHHLDLNVLLNYCFGQRYILLVYSGNLVYMNYLEWWGK